MTGDDLAARHDDIARLMGLCAERGRPELLTRIDRELLVPLSPLESLDVEGWKVALPRPSVPLGQCWVVAHVHPEPRDAFAHLVVGEHRLGPVWLPRRLDLIGPGENFSVTLAGSAWLPTGAHVLLFGWAFGAADFPFTKG